jgi:hypothetical protein
MILQEREARVRALNARKLLMPPHARFAGREGQIANTIAATSRTPVASIKISATSKPAIIRIFSMSASLGRLQLTKCSDQKHVPAQGLRRG